MRASDSSIKISSDSQLASLQIQFDDSSTDPNSPNFDPNADPEEVAAQQQMKFDQRLSDNIRADKDANTGAVDNAVPNKTDSQKTMAVRLHATAHDGVVPAEQGMHQLAALASIQSKSLDAPTSRVAGLENLSIRDFDNAQRI